MTRALPLRCQCGRVRGVASDVSPETVSRCLCYCHDCRAYMHHLERADVLDLWGGVDIVQIARTRMQIGQGRDQLRLLKLSPRGLHRWYAACCSSPIANTLPRVPFAGLSRSFVELDVHDEPSVFPEVDLIHPRSAFGGLPRGSDGRSTLRSLARPGRLFVIWMARGLGRPTPLYDRNEHPTVEPRVLTVVERQKLREHARA